MSTNTKVPAEKTEDVAKCPICDEPFSADDNCATDIEMGTCHAECLEGSPVVDLETGEETGGKVDTYRYSEVMDPPPPAQNVEWHSDPYLRIVNLFDMDATAGEFLAEDGEGGHMGAVYRMAREIERLRSGEASPAPNLEVLEEIKYLALTAGALGCITVPKALARMIGLCNRAGATRKLDDLRPLFAAPEGSV